MRTKLKQALSLLLTLVMVIGLLPVLSAPVSASTPSTSPNAGKAKEVFAYNGMGRIGNSGFKATNLALLVMRAGNKAAIPGITFKNLNSGMIFNSDEKDGYTILGDNRETEFTIKIADIPALKAVAEGGSAYWSMYGETCGDNGRKASGSWSARGRIWVNVNGTDYVWGDGDESSSSDGWGSRSTWGYCYATEEGEGGLQTDVGSAGLRGNSSIKGKMKLNPTDVIRVKVQAGYNKDDKKIQGIIHFQFYVWDETVPIASYDYEKNATVNSKNSKELLVKLGTAASDYNDPDARYLPANLTPEAQEYVDINFSTTKAVVLENAPKIDVTGNSTVTSAKSAYDAACSAYNSVQAEASAAADAESQANDNSVMAETVSQTINGVKEVAEAVEAAYRNASTGATGDAEIESRRDAAKTKAGEYPTPAETDTDYEIKYYKYYAAQGALGTSGACSALAGLRAVTEQLKTDNATSTSKSVIEAIDTAIRAATVTTVEEACTAIEQKVTTYQAAYTTAQTNYSNKAALVAAEAAKVGTALSAYNTAVEAAEAAAFGPGGTASGMTISTEVAAMLSHTLFTNQLGTGYMGMGQNRGLELYKCSYKVSGGGTGQIVTQARSYAAPDATPAASSAMLTTKWLTAFSYRYSARRGDFNGNNKIADGGGITDLGNYKYNGADGGDPTTLLQKINNAGFHDAAGNPLVIGTGNNPFSIYDVIVDAEPPTYSRVGNGVTPEILTGVVLNKNDTVNFTVEFSEAVIAKRGVPNDDNGTYLLFNNNSVADFLKKSGDGKQWTFNYTIQDKDNEVETPLWKLIALTDVNWCSKENAKAGNYTARAIDGRTITDYVGNMLADRANLNVGDTGNDQQVNSGTAWAELAVDNTAPVLTPSYEKYADSLTASTDVDWGQAGRIIVNATDSMLKMPPHDPKEPGADKYSKGIYRPQNATAGDSGAGGAPAGGLIYYTWTQDAAPPVVGDNFEAIKRYSLTGEQPNTVEGKDYAAAWKDYILLMSNNGASIVPPDEALALETGGQWYLHIWTADMTWDSARQLMQYDLMNSLKYNAGYNQAAYSKLKQDEIEQHRSTKAVQTSETYTAQDEAAGIGVKGEYKVNRPSYEEAWNAVKQTVFETAYTATFRGWLTESTKDVDTDDAMFYANTEAMKTVGNYAATTATANGAIINTWTLDKFAQEDSNWVCKTAEIRFDNKKPTVAIDKESIKGNNAIATQVSFTVSDEHGGVDTEKVYYQWIKKSGETAPTVKDWSEVNQAQDAAATVEPNVEPMTGAPKVTAIATTNQDYITEDGEYYLLVKVTDKAGNSFFAVSDFTVTRNSERGGRCEFSGTGGGYVRSVSPTAHVTGTKIREVYCVQSQSVEMPSDWGDALSEQSMNSASDKTYALPTLDNGKQDGTWYCHIKVVEDALKVTEPYYFYASYNLDNTMPAVTFLSNGTALPKESFDVEILTSDALSGIDSAFYQWAVYQEEQSAPAEDDQGWLTLENESVTLKDRPTGGYKLYVKITDKAGNQKICSAKEIFLLEKKVEELPEYSSNLLHIYEEGEKRYGVASLYLAVGDKTGYRYSISTDGGASWCTWLPYMSFIRMELPDETPTDGQLQVSFRAPGGTVERDGDGKLTGQLINTETADYTNVGPYATAEFDSMKARKDGVALTLLMSKPEDVTITAQGEDAATPSGDNFTVVKNGVYGFTLAKEEATTTLEIVVDIFDNDAPMGNVLYSDLKPTNATVIATLETGEPVRVTSAGGRNHSFDENGEFTFTFEDEAGNAGSAVAKVTNIDKVKPSVRIVANSGDGTGKSFGTLGTDAGRVAQGVVLTVEKTSPESKEFTVVSGDKNKSVTVTKNGTYTFIVADAMGNTATVSQTVDYIVNALPAYTIDYAFTNVVGAMKEIDGVLCAKADVEVTIKIPVSAVKGTQLGNAIYVGTQKIAEGDKSNQVAVTTIDGTEYYVYTKTYTANGNTTVALCDGLGNVERVPISVRGIDRTKPTVTLKRQAVSIDQNTLITNDNNAQTGFGAVLGGYTVQDNLSASENIKVVLAQEPDTSRVGRQRVIYAATDELGNRSTVEQTVYVLPADGLLVLADGTLLSGACAESAILPDNKVSFTVDEERMQQMGFRGGTARNLAMRYDLYYVTGLYREGQLKYIAEQLTSEELLERNFSFTFDKPGWYTIIIRNQERTREYTMFFVSAILQE